MWRLTGGVVYTDNVAIRDAVLAGVSDSCITHRSNVNNIPHWHVTCPASRADDARRICEALDPKGEVRT